MQVRRLVARLPVVRAVLGAPRLCPECRSPLLMCLGVERYTGAIGPRKLFLVCASERCTWKGPEAVVDVKVLVCDHGKEAVH